MSNKAHRPNRQSKAQQKLRKSIALGILKITTPKPWSPAGKQTPRKERTDKR